MTSLFKNSAFICCLFIASNTVAQVIIVNPQNTITELSRNSLRAIFAMRTPQWPNGETMHVFVLHDTAELHIDFCKHLLGMFPYQLRRVWDRQVFSGTGIAPTTVNSEQEMLALIATTKGAIGYISSENANSTVKIIEESR